MNSLIVWKIHCLSLVRKSLNNRVLVYPSESVYALGGNPFSPLVVNAIRRYKHYPLTKRKGFIILVSDLNTLQYLAYLSEKKYQEISLQNLGNRPLTIIAKAKKIVPKVLCNNTTIAIRIVKDIYIKQLLSSLRFPLISTSLNPPRKAHTKSKTKARVFAHRRNLNAYFIAHSVFTSDQTSRIYDSINDCWLR